MSTDARRHRLSAEDLETILGVTSALAEPFDLMTTLGEVVNAAKQVLHADRGWVWLFEPATDELVLLVATGIAPVRVRSGAGLVGACARERRIINVPDCYADPRFDPAVDRASGYRTRCMLTLPLVDHKDALVGVMQVLHRPPSFNEADVSDKPGWLAAKPLLTEEEITGIDEFRRNQLLTLISLDRTIGRAMTELQNTGMLDNTFILSMSENGKFWGEHRITSKNGIYDEASHVPFAIRYPPRISTPYIDMDNVVSNIEIAPTILEVANIPIPESMDGLSLLGLLSGNTEWREGILLEGWPPRGIYTAIHTKRYVYVETIEEKSEFYDLQTDPYQLENLIDDPAYQDLIEHNKELLTTVNIQKQVPTVTPEPQP